MRSIFNYPLKVVALRTCSFLLFALFTFSAKADEAPELKQLRQKLLQAINSSKTTDSLYTVLNKIQVKPPVIMGYVGILESLKGKHAWNPYSKIKYLNSGQRIMQQAITADPHNIEIRYLRFSVEYHLPAFLGMAKHIAEDRDEMLAMLAAKNYATADKQVAANIVKTLLESKKCTAQQNEFLHKQQAELK
ncbi:hypothetical protein KXQ82_18805 [Mucilaginibacter sp. HMF5004]|uniref:hypothetical protein n=1 Tax=Mucilaginibacter rivuli TaxID=2857527 RepID=UPI001C5EB0A1|nr:hypothetical protein [Mucilaginibacter rivuli]MBW4891783.1 hypothetical protein [Mucilaginibacter rivuli]